MSSGNGHELDASGYAIVAVSIIWAAVIFATAAILKGTDYFASLIPILGGGAASTIIILGGARRTQKR